GRDLSKQVDVRVRPVSSLRDASEHSNIADAIRASEVENPLAALRQSAPEFRAAVEAEQARDLGLAAIHRRRDLPLGKSRRRTGAHGIDEQGARAFMELVRSTRLGGNLVGHFGPSHIANAISRLLGSLYAAIHPPAD